MQFSESQLKLRETVRTLTHVTMAIITEITSVTTNTDEEVQASVKNKPVLSPRFLSVQNYHRNY